MRRLIQDKNVDLLIKSLSLLKRDINDISCKIIGDGPERERLKRLAHDLRLDKNVDFIGFLDKHDDVISHMKAAKVFVLPSTREGFGMVALEANACGLPVITVDHGRNAAADLITAETGYKCKFSEGDLSASILMGLNEGMRLRENALRFRRNTTGMRSARCRKRFTEIATYKILKILYIYISAPRDTNFK